MINFIKDGNIFEVPADALVNPVNCVGVMGKGLALEFRKRYPCMFANYKGYCQGSWFKPGRIHHWLCPNNVKDSHPHIFNFPTKVHWKDKSNYEYIDTGIVALFSSLSYLHKQEFIKPLNSINIPALGCGLGELKWEKVKDIINKWYSVFYDNHHAFRGIAVNVFEPNG